MMVYILQVMWYSSGGTKSVVHTDSVDNINCLYRGEKELYFVDPAFADKVIVCFQSELSVGFRKQESQSSHPIIQKTIASFKK